MSVNLTVDTAVPYLVEQGYLSAASIVASDLEVIDLGRRNQNLRIVRREGTSHHLKQAGSGEPATETTIRSEAAFYHHCAVDAKLAAVVHDVLPRLVHWDEERCLFISDLIDGKTLWAHYADVGPPHLPADSAAPLGDAIGRVHRAFREPSSRSLSWLQGLPTHPPWILLAHRPTPDMFAKLSPANIQVLGLMQRDRTLLTALDGLRRDWTTETVIHNDLKGENVIVTEDDAGNVSVHIVDWELIQVGDAAWDVGSVFRDFLTYWLLSVPLTADLSPEEMLRSAQIPLANLHPATRSFWHAYHPAAGIEASALGPFLLRSVGLAAARMAQGAYEASLSAQYPPNHAYAMLQLAVNMLSNPREAAVHLLGIPVPWRKS